MTANNQISSFKVSFNKFGGAVGSWEPVATGTGSITQSVVWGLSSINLDDTENIIKNSIENAMGLGFVYGDTTIADIVKASNRDALNRTSIVPTQSGTRTCKTNETKEAVGMWQWVVETDDRVIKASTEQFVCRYGAAA